MNLSQEVMTSDGQPPKPCSEYKDGLCQSSNERCDGCYSDSQKT